jgi:predicted dehydrogenase
LLHGRLLTPSDRRWDADYQTLLSLIQAEKIGRVVELESHFDRWSPAPESSWRGELLPGQGVAYDLGTHLIDQIVHAFGVPSAVTGFVSQQRDQGDQGREDACTILLHYDNMLATVKASALSADREQLRFWVRGDRGSFKKVSRIDQIETENGELTHASTVIVPS